MIEVMGQVIRAEAGDAALGEICHVERRDREPLEAEVVGFQQGQAILMPYGETTGLRASAKVTPAGKSLSIRCGKDLRGVLLDGLGRPAPAFREAFEKAATEELLVDQPPIDPYKVPRISTPLATGIRAIDGCTTLGEGQRIGLYAGLGVGQSTLMGRIATWCAADVVVVHIDAQPQREVLDFVVSELAEEGMARTIVVATSSSAPAIVRVRGLSVAQRIAESFRDRGLKVLLLVNDLRSVADAQDEIGRVLDEPLAPDGLAPSVYRMLANLFARAGNSQSGSITAIYGVKIYGAGPADPGADRLVPFIRRTLDGHIILNRQLGQRNHWPAIDVAVSLSRVMNAIVPQRHKELGRRVRDLFELYDKSRDNLAAGNFVRGRDAALDEAVERIQRINAFLQQGLHEKSTLEQTVAGLEQIFA